MLNWQNLPAGVGYSVSPPPIASYMASTAGQNKKKMLSRVSSSSTGESTRSVGVPWEWPFVLVSLSSPGLSSEGPPRLESRDFEPGDLVGVADAPLLQTQTFHRGGIASHIYVCLPPSENAAIADALQGSFPTSYNARTRQFPHRQHYIYL